MKIDMRKVKGVFFALALLISNLLNAQHFEELFEYGGAYINDEVSEEYLSPLVEVMNNSWHSGLFSASFPKDSFYFYLGVNVNTSFVPEGHRSYTTNSAMSNGQEIKVPTIFGVNEITFIEDENSLSSAYPGGFDYEQMPLAVPQATIGGILNTDLTVRFFALGLEDNIGNLNLFGLGLQHSLSEYLNMEKLNLSVSAAYHQVKTGEWLHSKHYMLRANIHKNTKSLHYYGFMGFQNGELSLKDRESNKEYVIKGENPLLLGAGISLDFLIFNLGFEAVYSSLPTLNANLGFKF